MRLDVLPAVWLPSALLRVMYYDLNIPWPARPLLPGSSSSHSGGRASSSSTSQQPPSKKLKGKQQPGTAATPSDAPKRGAELLVPHERAELEQSTRMAIKRGSHLSQLLLLLLLLLECAAQA